MIPLETERLILRNITFNDVEDMYRLDSNKEVHKYLGEGWMSKSVNDSRKTVKYIIEQYSERGIGRWAAIEKSSGKFIGWSGLKLNTESPLNGQNNFYDIGYRLLPEFWGKGYATESSRAALKYGFENLDLNIIYGITEINNEASHKVLLKIGLDYIEDFYDEFENLELRWYELTKEQYAKKMS